MNKITCIVALLAAFFCQSQNLPLDFEDGTTIARFSFDGSPTTNVVNPDMTNNPSTRALQALKGTNTNNGNPAAWFAGFGFASSGVLVDLSFDTTLTLKMRSSRANVPVRVRLQTSRNSAPAYNVDFTITSANTWEDITLDFAAANPAINGTEQYGELVIQPNFDPACAAAGANCVITNDDTFYFDDIIQVTSTNPATDATLSDLTVDNTTVTGFSPTVTTYDVEVPIGTTTVPIVGATASQAGVGSSSTSITQATAIPGSATVDVTAPDGVTMRTYSVNFAEETVSPSGIAPQQLSDGINLIVYSDVAPGATDAVVTNLQLDQFGNAIRGEVDLDGDSTNETFRLEDVGFYGAGWDAVNLTSLPYQFVHVHYFSESVNEFRFFLIDATAGIPGGNPEEPRFTVSTSGNGDAALVKGSWQSIFMPLSVFENFPTPSFNYDLTDINQYKFETGLPGVFGNGIMYVDNIFFCTTQTFSENSISVNSLLVSPNPTSNAWNFNDPIHRILNITLYDLTGRKVIEINPNAHVVQLDGSTMDTGIYLAEIITDSGRETIKIVKR
jgi:hypothetical protein